MLGLLIGVISMASTAYNATRSKDTLLGSSTQSVTPLGEKLNGSKEDDTPADSDDGAVRAESWWYFHLMMVACSLYMAMLLSDWSTEPARGPHDFPAGLEMSGSYSVSLPSFWVKLTSQWVCLLMYSWTLLAPYVLREHRDFGIEFDF